MLDRGVYYSLPFLFLFQAGFGYVGLMSAWEGAREWWARFGFSPARPEAGLE